MESRVKIKLGGVYMRTVRSESHLYEFIPVTVPERDFHSGTKTHSDVVSRPYKFSSQREITLPEVWKGLLAPYVVFYNRSNFYNNCQNFGTLIGS